MQQFCQQGVKPNGPHVNLFSRNTKQQKHGKKWSKFLFSTCYVTILQHIFFYFLFFLLDKKFIVMFAKKYGNKLKMRSVCDQDQPKYLKFRKWHINKLNVTVNFNTCIY